MNHIANQFAGLPLGQELPNDRTVTLIFSGHGDVDEAADEAAAVNDILMGNVADVHRVIQFNIAEGWCRDISGDVARELIDQLKPDDEDTGYGELTDFLEGALGCEHVARALSESLYG